MSHKSDIKFLGKKMPFKHAMQINMLYLRDIGEKKLPKYMKKEDVKFVNLRTKDPKNKIFKASGIYGYDKKTGQKYIGIRDPEETEFIGHEYAHLRQHKALGNKKFIDLSEKVAEKQAEHYEDRLHKKFLHDIGVNPERYQKKLQPAKLEDSMKYVFDD